MDFSEPWCDTCSKVGYAARLGKVDLLNLFIEERMPVDVPDNRGWRPLHEAAAASPTIECLEKLLKHGDTHINWTTHEGESALLLACKRRQGCDANAFVDLLLKYGADPNLVDNEEDSPLLEAIRSENKYVVERLIAAKANVNATDCSRWSPLHAAATFQDPTVLQFLLKENALVDIQDECGMTPIFTAAQHGCEKSLLELLLAAKNRNQESVVNIGAEDWATPVMIAAQQGFINCVKILLEYGADPNLETSDHATALHLAVQGDNKECLEMLLGKMNLEPLIKSFHPLTYEDTYMICPLHLAVEWGSHESLKSLLSAGFSPDSLYSLCPRSLSRLITYLPEHETALSYAAYKRDKVSMAILLSAGASCNPPVKTAFHPLISAFNNPEQSDPEPDIFHILIENGANVNYQRSIGVSNEVFLCSLVSSSIYRRLLLYYGCDPNLSFQNESEIFFFIRCAGQLLRYSRVSLNGLFKLLLRFLIVTKGVQCSFFELNSLFPADVSDILEEISKPSSLKQICTIKLRQHLYSIHGVKLPDMIRHLRLPPILEAHVACHELKLQAE